MTCDKFDLLWFMAGFLGVVGIFGAAITVVGLIVWKATK